MRLIQPRPLGQPRVPRGLHFEVVHGFSIVDVDVQPDGAPVEGFVQRFLYVQLQRLAFLGRDGGLLGSVPAHLIVLNAADLVVWQQILQKFRADLGIAHHIGEHEVVPDVHVGDLCGELPLGICRDVRISPNIVKRFMLKFAHGDHLRFVESLSVCGSQRRSVHLANLLIPHFDYTTERDA